MMSRRSTASSTVVSSLDLKPRVRFNPVASEAGRASQESVGRSLDHKFGSISVTVPGTDKEGPIEENVSSLAEQDEGRRSDSAPVVDSPPAAAPPPPSIVPPEPEPMTPPARPATTATVPTHIRAASSPAAMPDRIPPRVDTPASITIAGLTAPAQVTLSISGGGGSNGSVTINGTPTANLGATGVVQLRGVDQTAVGSAGNLRLVASHGATQLGISNGFSVSSIPQNFSTTFHSQIDEPARRGLRVNNHWESDSGSVADLNEAERSEQVQYGAATGIWAGVVGGDNSGYFAANNPPLVDSHGTPLARLTGAGSRIAEQTFSFNDKRSGAVDIAATNSGFRLTRTAIVNAAGRVEFTIDKRGTATTANGFASAAGAGTVTRTQVI